MKAAVEMESDSLASLEERILKAVELVGQLRRENANLQKENTALAEDKDKALAAHQASSEEAAGHKAEAERLAQELEALRGEQKNVRMRVAKLLELVESVGA